MEPRQDENTWDPQSTLTPEDIPDTGLDPEDFNLAGASPEGSETSLLPTLNLSEIIEILNSPLTMDSAPYDTPSYLEPLAEMEQDGANSSAADLLAAVLGPEIENNEVGEQEPTEKHDEQHASVSDESFQAVVEAIPGTSATSTANVQSKTVLLEVNQPVSLGEQALPTVQGGLDAPVTDEFILSLIQDTVVATSTEEVDERLLAIMPTSISGSLTRQTEYQVIPPRSFQITIYRVFQKIKLEDFGDFNYECYTIRYLIKMEYIPWMAQYLLKDYIGEDMSCHQMFSYFLDVLQVPAFSEAALEQTFRNIQILLTCGCTRTNSTEITVLNNLGHWLGLVTLAKNRPILQIKLDLKELVQTADLKGENALNCIVPFIAKIMGSCSQSKAFKPPNPWTMRILNTLSILRRKYRLSFKLHFEISLLLHNLGVGF